MISRLGTSICVAVVVVLVLSSAGVAQDRPVPRLSNGKPDLSGFWNTVHVVDITRDYNVCGTAGQPGCKMEGVKDLESLYTPYAREQNKKHKFDYAGQCKPFGYVRSWGGIMPVQLVHSSDSLAILFEQNNWWHLVPTDGRSQPKDPEPTWMGHSVGKWEGDTLVIDTVGFNGEAWLDPSNGFLGRIESDAMHTVERLSRPDFNTIQYELTIDDPKVYTKPFKNKRTFKLMKPGLEIQEYTCTPIEVYDPPAEKK